MRHQLTLASVCYVILASCSGQNLKSQNVQTDQGSKPAVTQPAESKSGGNDNILAEQAAGGKEIAGSFLTQCVAYSETEIGCNLYQRNSSSMNKYSQPYKQKILLNQHGSVETVEENKLKSTPEYQKVYVVSASQSRFIKTNAQNTNVVSTEVSGVGSVGFRTVLSFKNTEPEDKGTKQFVPFPLKEVGLFSTASLIVKPKLCISETSRFVATNVKLTVKVFESQPSIVRLTKGDSAREPFEILPCKVNDKSGYTCYYFVLPQIQKGDSLRFEGAAVQNGYRLGMESTDSYEGCNLPTDPLSALFPMAVTDFFSEN